jgi:F420-0:gamma-glutamyl ligase-like protein
MATLSKLYTTKEINAIREELIKKHGNKCAICEKPRSAFKKNLSVDHNHKTGQIRGLLCYRCNKFILGRQTYGTVLKMKSYLEKYNDTGG